MHVRVHIGSDARAGGFALPEVSSVGRALGSVVAWLRGDAWREPAPECDDASFLRPVRREEDRLRADRLTRLPICLFRP